MSDRPDLRETLQAAAHALRSYQYGNTATDLAREVAEACEAALAGAASGLPASRFAGPLGPADADSLRLMLDAGTLLILVRDRSGRAAAAWSAVSAEPQLFGPAPAQDLWMAIARAMPAAAALLDPSSPSLARPDQETSP